MDLRLFAERLNDLIFENKLSVGEVAKQSDVAKSTIYEYLSGTKIPTLENLLRLVDYFNCTTDFLLGLEDENYSTNFLTCKPFNERFNEVLKILNISRYKLKQIAALSESTLYYWSKGKTVPTVEKLVLVAKNLNCSLDFLIGRTS